ncbi:fasciclin domain-containing protein [Niabella sp. CC-SYL272]|uniref:fasciclin domain-containing protein n=1 Tax=Niabella agricola TaxID=2891571 RepID=UPI001F1992B4|nr:fasciclin domain-containing protein [Niabella agricola]MCF3108546.1 fasciclin domain-containing protein [Niabella agricola]
MKSKLKYTLLGSILAVMLLATACQKEYYFDSGLSRPEFNGSMMEYLESKPILFDTLVQVIKLAGLESNFRDSSFTFFAPADSTINSTVQYFNFELKRLGEDTIAALSDLKPEFWKATLHNYIFRSVKGLEDYPQLDLLNKQAFPGEFSRSVGGRVMNIGGIFTSARGVKYQGYRYLNISYVPNEAAPYNSWISARVATCNIKPKNGIVHVLAYAPDANDRIDGIGYSPHYFGFNPVDAWVLARYYGIKKQTN